MIIDCTVIFQVDPSEAPRIYIEWQDRYVDDLIRPTVRGLVRTYVSQYKVDEVNSSKRMDLEKDLTKELKAVLGQKGFIMDDFLLRNITFSKEYAAAVERKQVALQDAVKKQYEADQIQRLASGEAARIRLVAEAEADALEMLGKVLEKNPDVITLRYVEKLAPNVQVMLVPNNAPYLLPLSELTSGITTTTTLPTPTATPLPGLDGVIPGSAQTQGQGPGQLPLPTPTFLPTPTPAP